MNPPDEAGGESRDLVLATLVDEYGEARRKDPELTTQDYAARHPDFESELLEILPGLVLMETVAAHVSEAAALEETLESVPDSIGEYRIVRRIGRGGMGVVFLAVQESLDRQVALKVLPTTLDFDAGFLERFRREARVAGRLSHPHIVPVYGVGFADGRHYFAMRHIDGCALDEIVRGMRVVVGGARLREPSSALGSAAGREPSSARGDEDAASYADAGGVVQAVRALRAGEGELPHSLSVRGAVRIALQVAEALAYAHAEGVLHRDIKPGNILLDERGDAWVTDFGLCRIDGAANLTSEGAIIGTLRYMAPEQMEGASDERSDVYAVGLVLFEMLALRPAFDSTRRAKIVHDVLHTSPPRLRKLRVGVPRAIETIIQKATAKLSVERYPTAAALARDLRAFLENRPISARRPSALYLGRLFVTRHWVGAAVTAVALVLITLLAALYIRDLRASRLESQRRAYVGDLVAAEAALRAGSIQRAKHHLGRAPERFRAWEWAYLAARVDQSLGSVRLSDQALQSIAVDPRARRAAVAGVHGVSLVSLPGLRVEATLGGGEVSEVCWNESGDRLVLVRRWGGLEVVEVTSAAEDGAPSWVPRSEIPARWFGAQGPTRAAMLESFVLVGTRGGAVHLWDEERGAVTPLATLPGEIIAIGLSLAPGEALRWWAFSSAGSLVVGKGGGPRDPTGVDARGEQRRYDLPLGGDTVTDAWVEPSGDSGVLVTAGGALLEFSNGSVPLRRISGSERRLEALAVDGATVLAVGRDQLVHLVDRIARGRERSLSGSPHALRAIAIVPGTPAVLLTAGEDGVLRAWDRDVAGGGMSLLGHIDDVQSAAFHPEGRLLVTGGRDGQVILWDLDRAEPIARFIEPRAPIHAVEFSGAGDGEIFAVTGAGTLHRWRPPWCPPSQEAGGDDGGARGPWGVAHAEVELPVAAARDAEFDSAAGLLLVATDAGIERWSADLERAGERWIDGRDVSALHIDRGRDQFVGVTRDGAIFALERPSGALKYEVDSGYPAGLTGVSLTDTRTGRSLGVFGTMNHEIVVFDPANGRTVRVFTSRAQDGELGERLMGATFSPDGDRVLATTRNGLLSVWDPDTGEHLVDLRGHGYWAMRAVTSPVTGTVVSLAADESVRVWGTRSTGELAALRITVDPMGPPSHLAEVRRSLQPDAILESIWAALEGSGDPLTPELSILLESLYLRDPGAPLVTAVYGLARIRGGANAEIRALLAYASERLPLTDPRQPALRVAIADYDRARLLADTTLIRRSVESARLRPNAAVMRSIAGVLPFLPWGIVADAVSLVAPVTYGVRRALAYFDR